MSMRQVLDYTDYRLFLKDVYRDRKESEPHFSHRTMAAQLGFTSPNFLKLVMAGQRNLSVKSLTKITKGLDLSEKESEYFSYLVFFTQAKDAVAKNYYFGLITAIRSRRNVATLGADKFEYFSEWYIPAVRELVVGKRDPLDCDALSACMGGKVSAAKIRKAVDILFRLGMIQRDSGGIYVQTSALLNTEDELSSYAIRHYHEKICVIACSALSAIAPHEREFGSLTLRISAEGFRKIKARFQTFRQELLQMAGDDQTPDRICHANFQFYPIAMTKDSDYEKL